MEDFKFNNSIFEKIEKLKKDATRYKKINIKKSLNCLQKAIDLNEKTEFDIKLYEKLAKYLVLDKQFEQAFQLMQNAIYKLVELNYMKKYKSVYYRTMSLIFETISFICYSENKIKTALFYKLQSMGYDLIVQSLNGSPIGKLDFEVWFRINSNRLYKNIIKRYNKSIDNSIFKLVEETYNEYSERILNCRKYYIENPYILFEAPNTEPIGIKELFKNIIEIPNMLKDKFNKLELQKKLSD